MQELTNSGTQTKKSGVGFIKSRKSEEKLMEQAADLIKQSSEHGIDIVDVIIDDSSGIDIDRSAIDDLAEWIESRKITTVVLRKFSDVADDLDDREKFFINAEVMGVEVLSVSDGFEPAFMPRKGILIC